MDRHFKNLLRRVLLGASRQLHWVWALLLVVVLAGCGVAAMYAEPEVISGDENEVAVKTGVNSNPGPTARAHCARYNRTAVLYQGPIEVGLHKQSYVYYFRCT